MPRDTIPIRARLRAALALALSGQLIAAGRVDGAPRIGPFYLTVRSPSVGTTLRVDGTRSRVYHGRTLPRGAGLVLRFLSDAACLSLFSGGVGTPIPVPRTLHPGRILSLFRTASGHVARIMGNAATSPEQLVEKTALLLRATAEGICTVGNGDNAVAAWARRVEPGAISIDIENALQMGVSITSRDGVFSVAPGLSESSVVPRARLRFAGVETAHSILTGTARAGDAVARGDLSLRGRIPMIRNLFPLMDRLGDLMRMEGPA